MLLFLCLKSSQTHKKYNEVAECQGSSDICERMSRIWPWAPQPPSPEQSIIGTSCSEGVLEEVIEKGKVTSVAVQIPPIYKEEQEAEQCINQYKYDTNVEDMYANKSTNRPIENMGASDYFLYPFIITKQNLPDHTKLYINPNSQGNLRQFSSNTLRNSTNVTNVNYPQRNIPSNTIRYSDNHMYNPTQSENAPKEYVRIIKTNLQQQNIYGHNPNQASTSARYSGQEKIPEQPYQNKPHEIKLEYSDNRTYSPINNAHSWKQPNTMPIPYNSFSANKSFGYTPTQKVEPNKMIIMGQNVPGHNSQTRYMRYEPANNKGVPVMPKLNLQEPLTTNKHNNFQHIPVKITQNKESYDNYTVKKSSQENPPSTKPQFKVKYTCEENATGQNSPNLHQVRPHPIRLEFTDNLASEPIAYKRYSLESRSQSMPMDVNCTTGDQKSNSIGSNSEENFPKIQRSLKFAYQDPMKFVTRSISDELLLKKSLSRQVSFKSMGNWTEPDILDISTSRNKSASISDETNYIPLGSLHTSEKSKEIDIRRLSQFSSLFPEDPKNPIPKDPSALPLNRNFEKMRMSSIQLSEKISEIGSKTPKGRATFKTGNNSNHDDVSKTYTLFNFRTPHSFQTTDHKSNENIMLNRDSASIDSSTSPEIIEIKIHQTELSNDSDSVEDKSENESISIELYNITIPFSSDESQNQKPGESTIDESNEGKKCNSLEILCSDDNFNNKATKYVEDSSQSTLIPNKISKTVSLIERDSNSLRALPRKILHSEELCCLQLGSSNDLLNRILPNNLGVYENSNKYVSPVVTNSTFQQYRENLYNEYLKSNSSIGTSDSEQLKDSVVFYNQRFNNNASSDIGIQSIPESEHHGQTLPNTSTPELTRKRQSDSDSEKSNIKKEMIATKTPLQNDGTTNLPKISPVLKWRIVMEKSKQTK